MLRMRLLKEAYAEIKEKDPNTALSFYALQKMVVSGEIPHHKVGSRRLVNMDLLEEYLSNPKPIPDKITYGTIRPVKLK